MSENADQLNKSIEKQLTYKAEDRPRRSKDLDKLAAGLAKAQGAMKNAGKDGAGTYGNYSTLASTWDSVRSPLSDNGIALIQRPALVDGKPFILTMLIHESGQFLDDAELELKFDTNNRMNAMQAMGSAITYARRYSAQAVTGIAPTDDDDGAGSGDPKPQGKGSNKPQDKPKPQDPAKPQDKPKDVTLDPLNFVMPFGDAGVKGTKLNDIPEITLKNISKYCDDELKKDPKPKNAATLLQISINVKAVLKLWEERRKEEQAVTNVDKKTGEILPPELSDNVLPEDQTQASPDYENQTQETNAKGKPAPQKKDPADTLVGMDFDTVDGVNGKKLREIPEAALKLMIKELDKKMQTTPPPPNISSLFSFKSEISAFLKSVGS